jgi:RHS repeat-associated protein
VSLSGTINQSLNYTYDSMGRLETVTRDGTLVESYGYDLDGTRTFETNTLRGITSRSLSHSDEDHLLTAGGVTYNYDLDGFLTTKTDGTNVTYYSYSSRGELLQVDLADGRVVTYEHDPMGRRIAKRIDGTIVEKYLWQGLTRLLAVYDGSDNLVQRFEYADSRLPVAMTQGGSSYYLGYDQVGSLRVVADASGNVVKRIDYDSFGNIIADTDSSFSVPLGFAGGLHDRDIGLVRFGLRDYDPDTGRWTAKDPIGFAGGDTDLYGYVQNNPVNSIDPLGLEVLLAEYSQPSLQQAATGALMVSDGATMVGTWIAATFGSASFSGPMGVVIGIETSPALIGGFWDMSHGFETMFPGASIPGLDLGFSDDACH